MFGSIPFSFFLIAIILFDVHLVMNISFVSNYLSFQLQLIDTLTLSEDYNQHSLQFSPLSFVILFNLSLWFYYVISLFIIISHLPCHHYAWLTYVFYPITIVFIHCLLLFICHYFNVSIVLSCVFFKEYTWKLIGNWALYCHIPSYYCDKIMYFQIHFRFISYHLQHILDILRFLPTIICKFHIILSLSYEYFHVMIFILSIFKVTVICVTVRNF